MCSEHIWPLITFLRGLIMVDLFFKGVWLSRAGSALTNVYEGWSGRIPPKEYFLRRSAIFSEGLYGWD